MFILYLIHFVNLFRCYADGQNYVYAKMHKIRYSQKYLDAKSNRKNMSMGKLISLKVFKIFFTKALVKYLNSKKVVLENFIFQKGESFIL